MSNAAIMTDEEFDAWQRACRLSLQAAVCEAYARARARPSHRLQAIASAYSLYERTTRACDDSELDELRAVEQLCQRSAP